MTDYKPGTVAMVRQRMTGDKQWDEPRIAFYSGYHQRWIDAHDGQLSSDVFWEYDIRPLVVLDLDGLVEPQRLVDSLRHSSLCGSHAIADAIAEQIEAQTKPPRIPEPGLWGVVEATHPLLPTHRWVHHEKDRWVADQGTSCGWDDLRDPVLIREGFVEERQ